VRGLKKEKGVSFTKPRDDDDDYDSIFRPRSTQTGYWAVPTATAGIAILIIPTYK